MVPPSSPMGAGFRVGQAAPADGLRTRTTNHHPTGRNFARLSPESDASI